MKNVKKIIMALVLGVTLSSVVTCGEIVSAREINVEVKPDEFWLSEDVGYRLNIEGAACGSRFYSLSKTSDSGEDWTIINEDPYNGRLGVAAGISFINEKLGFICLSHSGGSYGEMYRTEDGGKSFKEVSFQDVQVKLGEDETYNPFDLPEAPYEEDGCLYVLVGQGQDGDYNGGCKALYKSQDNGLTWDYVKEISDELEG